MTDSPRLRPAAVPATRAVRAAAVAVVTSWLPLVLLSVVAWAGSAGATVGWPAALGVGSLAWVAGHGGSVRQTGVVLSLTPLLLTALAVASAAVAARTLAGPVEDDRSPRLGWLGGMRSGVARLVGAFIGSYAVLGLLVALHASRLAIRPSWPSTASTTW